MEFPVHKRATRPSKVTSTVSCTCTTLNTNSDTVYIAKKKRRAPPLTGHRSALTPHGHRPFGVLGSSVACHLASLPFSEPEGDSTSHQFRSLLRGRQSNRFGATNAFSYLRPCNSLPLGTLRGLHNSQQIEGVGEA